MATLQVRAMDDRLYEALGRRAAMDNRSISQEVVMIVKEYLSAPDAHHKRKTESFLELDSEMEIAESCPRSSSSSLCALRVLISAYSAVKALNPNRKDPKCPRPLLD